MYSYWSYVVYVVDTMSVCIVHCTLCASLHSHFVLWLCEWIIFCLIKHGVLRPATSNWCQKWDVRL